MGVDLEALAKDLREAGWEVEEIRSDIHLWRLDISHENSGHGILIGRGWWRSGKAHLVVAIAWSAFVVVGMVIL